MTDFEKMALEIVQEEMKRVKKDLAKHEQYTAGFGMVQPIAASAKKVLQALEAKMTNGYVKLDATDGLYMPVSVEQIAKNTISVAHYYEQNGDLMADIEIVFLKKEYSYGVEYYPIYEKMDGFSRSKELVQFEGDRPVAVSSMQKDAARFCTGWLNAIKQQQHIAA